MTPSQACFDLIKQFEGCSLTAYLPTAHDVPTVGWGHTRGVQMGDVWTQQQADDALADDVTRVGQSVDNLLTGATTQNQFDAMTSLAYNIGVPGFGTSTVLRDHNAGDYPGAAAAFLLWNKQAGIVLPGLVRRRQAESDLYQGAPANA